MPLDICCILIWQFESDRILRKDMALTVIGGWRELEGTGILSFYILRVVSFVMAFMSSLVEKAAFPFGIIISINYIRNLRANLLEKKKVTNVFPIIFAGKLVIHFVS